MTTSLLDSPFFVLRASVRDDRHALIDKAEERSLVADAEVCNDARTTLTTPRLRLNAELNWLPGVAPRRAKSLAEMAQQDALPIVEINGIPPLAACNLVAAWLTPRKSRNEKEVAVALEVLSNRFQCIDTHELLLTVNEDREAAGFPAVPGTEQIDDLLQARRADFSRVMRDGLAQVERPDSVLTGIVREEMNGKDAALTTLTSDLVTQYEAGVQQHLDHLRDHIETYCDHVVGALDGFSGYSSRAKPQIDDLERMLRLWEQIASPLLLASTSQGKDEPNTRAVTASLRRVTLKMVNDHNMMAEGQRLTELQRELFSGLTLYSEQLDEDVTALDNLRKSEERSKAEIAEWEEKITRRILIGDRILRSSPDGISYQGQTLPLSDITSVRWGVFKQYYNGIRTNRKYTVWIQSGRRTMQIECVTFMESEEKVQGRFSEVIQMLWDTVMGRLIRDLLDLLARGEMAHFSGCTLSRDGAVLQEQRMFGSGKLIPCGWEDLRWQSGAGYLRLLSASNKKVYTDLVYRDTPNAPVLEAALNYLAKDGNLTKLLRGELP
ncbi:hypothetical protein [Cupriavidus sp. CP313]